MSPATFSSLMTEGARGRKRPGLPVADRARARDEVYGAEHDDRAFAPFVLHPDLVQPSRVVRPRTSALHALFPFAPFAAAWDERVRREQERRTPFGAVRAVLDLRREEAS